MHFKQSAAARTCVHIRFFGVRSPRFPRRIIYSLDGKQKIIHAVGRRIDFHQITVYESIMFEN